MDNWAEGLDEVAITITNSKGEFIDMNKTSKQVNLKDITKTVVGQHISHCHNARSNKIIEGMINNKSKNIYTITKNGRKKLIYQSPWFEEDGSFGGLIEISMFLPDELPHYNRDITTK